jgi:hypothetical protein
MRDSLPLRHADFFGLQGGRVDRLWLTTLTTMVRLTTPWHAVKAVFETVE